MCFYSAAQQGGTAVSKRQMLSMHHARRPSTVLELFVRAGIGRRPFASAMGRGFGRPARHICHSYYQRVLGPRNAIPGQYSIKSNIFSNVSNQLDLSKPRFTAIDLSDLINLICCIDTSKFSTNRPHHMATRAWSGMRAALRAPNRGQKCIPGVSRTP
jgi:hypothetical protein